jgi:hypothetical protein
MTTEGVDGGELPKKGTLIGYKGADGNFHYALGGNDGSIAVTSVPEQLSGVPSSFAFQTADATVFTLAAGERGFIQNCDDVALAVKLGASASTTSLSMILGACSVADDGRGGSVVIDDWIGAVSVAAMSGTARYLAWKVA